MINYLSDSDENVSNIENNVNNANRTNATNSFSASNNIIDLTEDTDEDSHEENSIEASNQLYNINPYKRLKRLNNSSDNNQENDSDNENYIDNINPIKFVSVSSDTIIVTSRQDEEINDECTIDCRSNSNTFVNVSSSKRSIVPMNRYEDESINENKINNINNTNSSTVVLAYNDLKRCTKRNEDNIHDGLDSLINKTSLSPLSNNFTCSIDKNDNSLHNQNYLDNSLNDKECSIETLFSEVNCIDRIEKLKKIKNIIYKNEPLFKSPIMDVIVRLFREYDVHTKCVTFDTEWIFDDLKHIIKCLKKLIDAMDVCKHRSINFVVCVVVMYRRCIDLKIIYDKNVLFDAYLKFLDIIRKCMLSINPQFWQSWYKFGFNNGFYSSCLIVENILFKCSIMLHFMSEISNGYPDINMIYEMHLGILEQSRH